ARSRRLSRSSPSGYAAAMPNRADQDAADLALVEAFFAAFSASDLDGALALMDDDVVYQNVPFPADRGKAAVARTLQIFGRFLTGFAVHMRNIAARDGVVLTERVDILSGPLVHLEIWVCGTFEVRDGKITLWRDYFDLASATAQLVTSPIRKLLHLTR
ncbi:MAG TPA: limonene-1,2-epoxide hydrolase family protein, partial [Polyangia bacterium]|nr:limonene-1,2-epoxide hydrolase family protein [Polyangia bacterium]